MVKQKKLTDPLSDIDPIMEQAFSEGENGENSGEGARNVASVDNESVSHVKFPDLNAGSDKKQLNHQLFEDIKIQVSVQLGSAKLTLKDILHLNEGDIVELDRLVGEPLDLVVNNQVVAQGEVVAVNQLYGFRVTKIVSRYEA